MIDRLEERLEAQRLFDLFYNVEIDGCYGTTRPQAKIFVNILIDEKLQEIPYINNTDRECRRRMYLMDVRSELKKL